MPFTNPILAGLTLVRQAIRSPNFLTGVTGWSIERDGSAEFNNATIRGTLITGGTTVTEDAIPAELTTYYGSGISSVIIQSGSVATLYGYSAMVTRLGATYLVTGLVDTTQVPAVMEVTAIEYPTAGAPNVTVNTEVNVAGLYSSAPAVFDGSVEMNSPNSTLVGMPILSGYSGKVNVSLSASTNGSTVVTFPNGGFSAVPDILLTIVSGSGAAIRATVFASASSATQMTVRVDANAAVTATIAVHWAALTP